MTHLMNNYSRQAVSFTRGEGVWLIDDSGKRYLDGLAGIAVNTLGHGHPQLVAALSAQIGKLIHTSNLYQVPQQERLASKLVECTGLSAPTEVFFCNSGCEANEAAIKLARFYGHKRNIEAPAIIVMENAFHGRSMATLSATGNRKIQHGFEPLVRGFVRVPYNDIDALKQVAEHNPNVVAVMLEIIQGEGGIQLADAQYQRALAELCEQHEWLLICDEVQCGMGRTGKWFGFSHSGIEPDIITMAKGLGSGVPIGACIASKKAYRLFSPGNHGTTFGGNPLACTAALTTIEVMEQQHLLDNAAALGNFIRNRLAQQLAGVKGVVSIRGAGLMIGIELNKPCGAIVATALAAGLLINVTHENVVRILPALIMKEQEAGELVDRLVPIIKQFLQA